MLGKEIVGGVYVGAPPGRSTDPPPPAMPDSSMVDDTFHTTAAIPPRMMNTTAISPMINPTGTLVFFLTGV